MKSGIPLSSPALKKGIDTFVDYIRVYGYPDRTWDLAWVTILFTEIYQGEQIYEKIAKQAINKLIAGASQEKENYGLWGPMCVNPDYLLEIIEWEENFDKKNIIPLTQKIAKTSNEKSKIKLENKLLEFKTQKRRFEILYKEWGVSGYSFSDYKQRHIYPPQDNLKRSMPEIYSISKTGGYAYNWTCESRADLECTAFALKALKHAAEKKLLPIKTPALMYERKKLGDSIDTVKILKGALSNILKLQQKDGGWYSYSSIIGHRTFRKYGIETPKFPKDTEKKNSDLISSLHASSSLLYLNDCLGNNTSKYTNEPLKASKAFLDGKFEELIKLEKNILFFNLLPLVEDVYKNDREIWQKVASTLIKSRILNSKFWTLRTFKFLERSLDVKSVYSRIQGDHSQLATSQAVLYLASGIRPPLFAIWGSHKNSRPPLIITAIKKYMAKKGTEINLIVTSNELPEENIANVPLLVISESKSPLNEKALKNLNVYLSDYEGHLLCLATPGESGTLFTNKIKDKLKEFFPNLKETESSLGNKKVKTVLPLMET